MRNCVLILSLVLAASAKAEDFAITSDAGTSDTYYYSPQPFAYYGYPYNGAYSVHHAPYSSRQYYYSQRREFYYNDRRPYLRNDDRPYRNLRWWRR